MLKRLVGGFLVFVGCASAANAEIKVGAILSLTGPAASLGIPAKNAIDILPRKIGNETVRYIILDDASDTSTAVRAARKLTDDENVDVILGPSITPTSLAILEVIGQSKTPTVSLAGSSIIAAPPEGNRAWAFKLAPQERIMAAPLFKHMKRSGYKTVGFIGFNDAFGDSFTGAMKKAAAEHGVQSIIDERYVRTDQSVTAQALRVIAAKPDAVLICASGTPGVTPILELKKLGYKGQVYVSQALASSDVLRLGGATLDGVFMSVAPVLVAEQLPDGNQVKPAGLKFAQAYEEKYGKGTRSLFGATAWDAYLLFEQAAQRALKSGKSPGTPEFREAVKDAMQDTKELVASQGVFNMTPKDHNGTDERSQLLVVIEKGSWKYVPLE